jgi:hypothetical protein
MYRLAHEFEQDRVHQAALGIALAIAMSAVRAQAGPSGELAAIPPK